MIPDWILIWLLLILRLKEEMVKNALFKRASIPKFPELHFPARFFKNYKKIKNSDKQVKKL